MSSDHGPQWDITKALLFLCGIIVLICLITGTLQALFGSGQ